MHYDVYQSFGFLYIYLYLHIVLLFSLLYMGVDKIQKFNNKWGEMEKMLMKELQKGCMKTLHYSYLQRRASRMHSASGFTCYSSNRTS